MQLIAHSVTNLLIILIQLFHIPLSSSYLYQFCPLILPNGVNLRVNDPSVHMMMLNSAGECALECFSWEPWCTAFTFLQRELICSLHGATVSNFSVVSRNEQSISYTMGVPDMLDVGNSTDCTFPFTLEGTRYSTTCALYQESVCQMSICPIYAPHSNIWIGCQEANVGKNSYSPVISISNVNKNIKLIKSRWLWIQIFVKSFPYENMLQSSWSQYNEGYYYTSHDMWLGNYFINQLTANKLEIIDWNTRSILQMSTNKVPNGHSNSLWRLMVELKDVDQHWFSAQYNCFYVASELDSYAIEISGFLEEISDMGDGFKHLTLSYKCLRCEAPCYREPFSTHDRHSFSVKGINFDGWWYSKTNPTLSYFSESQLMGVLTSSDGWWPSKDNLTRIEPVLSRLFMARHSSFQEPVSDQNVVRTLV